jgi:hypothetical protein
MRRVPQISTWSRDCRPARQQLRNLEDIASDYRRRYAGRARDELALFRRQPTLEAAIRRASRAEDEHGRRFAHQRRLPHAVLTQVEATLTASQQMLRRTKTFAELHASIGDLIGRIHGVGDLMIYDTALRIGAWRRLKPKDVYLHAGARVGARALGLGSARSSVPRAEIPAELRRLAAHEIEDVFCIYKDQLSDVRYVGADL